MNQGRFPLDIHSLHYQIPVVSILYYIICIIISPFFFPLSLSLSYCCFVHSFMILFLFLSPLMFLSSIQRSVVKRLRSLRPCRGLVPARSGLPLPSKSLLLFLFLFLHSEVVVEAGLSADARLPPLLHADPRHAPPILQDPQLEGSSIHFIYSHHHSIIITPLPACLG